jgi:hypothetical protein
VVAAALTLAVCAAAAPSVATGQDRCEAPVSHTLAADAVARVFASSGAVYGCIDATGVRRNLGGSGVCNLPAGRVGPARLVGVTVAYGLKSCGVDTASSKVLVRDLARSRPLTDVPATTLPLRAESFVTVATLVLRGGGEIGWIAAVASIGTPHETYEVHRVVDGTPTLLDSGTTIHPSSLRLVRSRMTWRDGSVTRSARL